MIPGVGVISIWDGFRSDFTFWQFFLRFVMIFTIYKVYDMIFFDYFLLCKFHFFPAFTPEVTPEQLTSHALTIFSEMQKMV